MKKTIIFLAIISRAIFGSTDTMAQAGNVYTVAGGGTSSADGVPATTATIVNSEGIAMDASGNLYFSDWSNYVVRKVVASTGLIYTVAGTGYGTGLTLGDGGPATSANLGHIGGVTIDAAGNLFLADLTNFRVRKVDAVTGIITSVAGGGTSFADGIAATSAKLDPYCVLIDSIGNIYTGDDSGKIRKINPTTGIITTVAGGGTLTGEGVPALSCKIYESPKCLRMDRSGNLYYVDYNTSALCTIRKIDAATGRVHTVAGGGTATGNGVVATTAILNTVYDFHVDPLGNIFIADGYSTCIRKVDAGTGLINTIAGVPGGGGSTAEGVPALSAWLQPAFIYLDQQAGTIYVTDFYSSVRKFSYPLITSGITWTADSFTTTVGSQCGGPQLNIQTNSYTTGMTVVTSFGDGSTATTPIAASYMGTTGFASVTHTYAAPGIYNIKEVLYSGSMASDSMTNSYTQVLCNSLFIEFYHDGNSNCIMDTNEYYNLQPLSIEVDSNSVAIDTISATSGIYYVAYGNPGDVYSFHIITMPSGFTATCPASGVISDTLSAGAVTAPTAMFGTACNLTAGYDLSLNAIEPVTGVNYQWGEIYPYNTSCLPESTVVTLTYSPKYIFSGDAFPPVTSTTANSISWDLSGISADVASAIGIYYSLDYNPASGPLITYDTVQSYYTISAGPGDIDTSNNHVLNIDTVMGGYDPNEMSVRPGGYIAAGTLLHYSIGFENTGTDTAYNIYVMDTLSDNVDLSTFHMVAASARMNIAMLHDAAHHNVIKFDFPGIHLLDSAHHGQCNGAVMFDINARAGLPGGTTIFNHAGIFFDSNPVVMTNTVEDIITMPSKTAVCLSAPLASVFPNPATDELTVKIQSGAYGSCTISNMLGIAMLQKTLSATQTTIDISVLPAGVYHISLKGDNGTSTLRFVKM